MTFHLWRLSEAGEENLGLACAADGLVLGRTRLIERRDEGFIVRERSEIERLLRRAYESDPPVERIMQGLATVARALNANDQCLARIAAVHLRLPDLQTQAARDAVEAEDRLIKYARDEGGSAAWDPAEHPRTGTSPNPGWFAPKPGDTSPIHTVENDVPTGASDASPSGSDDWVRLRPGPKRIDELADFIEWIANARPGDEQAIRAEIKRYFADAGDQGSAAALNAHLTALLKPGVTREQRQRLLDLMDVFTRVDPAEYARTRDLVTGAAIAVGGVPPAAAGETRATGGVASEGATAERAAAEANPASAEVQAPSEAWTYGWAKRGNTIHERFSDGSLPPLFRTIDNFTGGIATSLKSIDLNAATYQKTAQLGYRINTYVDTLGNYEGGSLSTTQVDASDIKERALNLIVPRGSVTEEMKSTIEVARKRAMTANKYPVKIIVTEY